MMARHETFPADTGADQFYPPPTVTFGDLKLTEPGVGQVAKTGDTVVVSWQPPSVYPQSVTYKLHGFISKRQGTGRKFPALRL